MWLGQVRSQDLSAAGRWTVSYFSADEASQPSAYPMSALRHVVQERKSTIHPRSITGDMIDYLSLEHIRSDTGELVGFKSRVSSEVKSRLKTFQEGDVLFGRLRPELNKVYLAEGEVSSGICSNEFIVLRALPDKIIPRYLRHVLASPYVTRFAAKLRTGASLPRISAADLLDLSIPLPTLEVQEEIAKALAELDKELRLLRQRIERLPTATTEALTMSLQHGRNELIHVEQRLNNMPD